MKSKKLLCFLIGHDRHFRTEYVFTPETMEHVWTQVKFCIRCGAILKKVITRRF